LPDAQCHRAGSPLIAAIRSEKLTGTGGGLLQLSLLHFKIGGFVGLEDRGRLFGFPPGRRQDSQRGSV
jgi:hypothetical protein